MQSKIMKFYGISESKMRSALADLSTNSIKIDIVPAVNQYEIWLKLTIDSDQLVDTENELNKIANRFSDFYFSNNIDETLADVVVALLKAKQYSITAAESLTAGMFQSTIASVSGASAIFKGGFVTYSNEIKAQLLNIPSSIIKQNGVVSESVAKLMAENSKQIMNTKLGVSFTGVAGPDSLEGEPVGTVWIGIAGFGSTYARKLQLSSTASRNEIREESVMAALRMLWLQLK